MTDAHQWKGSCSKGLHNWRKYSELINCQSQKRKDYFTSVVSKWLKAYDAWLWVQDKKQGILKPTHFITLVSFCRRVEAVLYCLATYQVSISFFVWRWVSCVSHHCCLIFFRAVTDWLIGHDLVAQDLFLLFPLDNILSAEQFKSVGTDFTALLLPKMSCCPVPMLVLFSSLCQQKHSCTSEWGTQSWDQLDFFIFPPAVSFCELIFQSDVLCS